jgi:hypothetical protein
MTTKPTLQKSLKGMQHMGDKNKHNHDIQEVLNPTRTDKDSEGIIEFAACTQILEQQKYVNGQNHHIPLNTNIEC